MTTATTEAVYHPTITPERQLAELLTLLQKKLHLLAHTNIDENSLLATVIDYQLNLGSSRTRAKLALQISQLIKIPTNDAILLAAACELLHQASLVHDDLQDKQLTRRNKPTIWQQFGSDYAICLGDLLISSAYAALAECGHSEKSSELIHVLHRATTKCISGQLADIASKQGKIDLIKYEKIVQAKSGTLLLLPIELAAAYTNDDTPLKLLKEFFIHYTTVYQALDDVADYEEDWLNENALEPPNLLAIMYQQYQSIDLARQAVKTYIEKALNNMQKICACAAANLWSPLLLFYLNNITNHFQQFFYQQNDAE